MVRKRFLSLSILLALSAALLAGPFGPREWDEGSRARPGPSSQPSRRFGDPSPWRRWPGSTQDYDAEWREASQFFQENAPTLWKAFEKVQSMPQRAYFRGTLAARFREIKRLRDTGETPLYENKLQQVRTEDRISALVWDLKKTPGAATDEAREQLASQIKALIDLRLEEGRQRIARIKRLVQEEESRLAEDVQRQEEMKSNFLRESLKGDTDWLRSWRNRPGPTSGPHHRGSGGPD
jgi:hypothetical protein